MTEIKSLTGLRGVAALYVVFHHLLAGRDGTGPFVQKLVLKGYLAVDVFFVLSGLVMALTYHRMFAGHYRLADHADFLIRRAARILPLYLCVLILSVCLRLWKVRQIDDATLFGNFLLVQSWGFGIQALVEPSWSISTETAAYLLFPLLCLPTLRSARLGTLSSLCAAFALVFAATVLTSPAAKLRTYGALDLWDGTTAGPMLRCLGGFTVGLLVFRAAESLPVRRLARFDTFGYACLGLLLTGILLDVNDLVLYPLFPALVLFLCVNQGRLSQALSSRPLHRLGVLSYSIYLIHSLVIELLWPASQSWMAGYSTPTRGVVSAALCLGVVLLCAPLLHTLVEKPARSWVRRFA